MKWFVYVGPTYYPWGEVVDADTPEEAVIAAEAGDDNPVLVFPWDALAYRRTDDGDDLRIAP